MNNEPNSVDSSNDAQPGLSQENEVPKSYNSADISSPVNLKNVLNKGVNLGKKGVNGIIKLAGKALRAAKVVVAAVSNPVGLIIMGILFFIIVVLVVINNMRNVSVKKNVNTSSKKIIESWDKNNLTDQQKTAKSSFELSGSLLDFSMSDIRTFVDDLKSTKDSLPKSSDEREFYEEILKTKGSNLTLNTDRIASPDDQVSLYEHILLTAKYDFNNVKWKRYGHGHDGDDSPMVEDTSLGVRYPTDQTGTKYETFSSLLRPYLLSYEVPTSFLAGVLSDKDMNNNMVYDITKYALSDITVNRYDVETYTMNTYYLDYDYTNYHSSFSMSVNVDSNTGIYYLSFSPISYVEDGKGHVNTVLDENGNHDRMKETLIPESSGVSYSNMYYVAEANLFDIKISNAFNYIKYSMDDVNSRSNYDTEDFSPEAYNPVIDEQNKLTGIAGAVGSCSAEQLAGVINNICAANGVSFNPGNYTFNSNTYQERNGTKTNVTRTWADRLSQSESKEDFYTAEDVVRFNENLPNGSVSADEFKSDEKSTSYYSELESNKKLNRVDFINSNPTIFNTYLLTDKHAKYVGLSRNYLESFSYGNLKDNWQGLVDDYKNFPYVYGKTYGFGRSQNSNTPSQTGISLLREYLRSWEGIGSDEDKASTKVVTEGDKEYYVVATTMTVGYGIDLRQNPGWKKEIEELIGAPVQPGTKIETSIIDQYEENYMMAKYNKIKADYPDLKEYQVHALVVRAYNTGNADGYADHKGEYNEETDDQYDEIYAEFKDNATATSTITARARKDSVLYQNYLSKPTSAVGYDDPYILQGRRFAEWCLFSLGYYDRLKKFYKAGGGSPAGIDLLNADGTVNEAALVELRTWYEDNIFGGYFHGDEYHIDNPPSWYSAKTLEAAKHVQGEIFKMTGIDPRGGPYKAVSSNNLGIFQCTWWADCRARLYLQDNGYTGNFSANRGDGGSVVSNLAKAGYANLINYDINKIRPHSIASFGNTGTGHVVFIEDVGTDGYIISHCGSGHVWHGVDKIPLGTNVFSKPFRGSLCLDDLL